MRIVLQNVSSKTADGLFQHSSSYSWFESMKTVIQIHVISLAQYACVSQKRHWWAGAPWPLVVYCALYIMNHLASEDIVAATAVHYVYFKNCWVILYSHAKLEFIFAFTYLPLSIVEFREKWYLMTNTILSIKM